jgi:hypothetical protein
VLRPSRGLTHLIVAVLLALGAGSARAQSGDTLDLLDSFEMSRVPPVLHADSLEVDRRLPDRAAIERFRDDEDFQYGSTFKESESLLGRVLRSISEWLQARLGEEGTETFMDVLTYAIVAFSVILVVMKLMGAEIGLLFFRRRRNADESRDGDEGDVRTIDYDARIAAAVAAGDLRLAVRLHYLRLLRDLDESDAIEWKQSKTDSDYARELVGRPQHDGFERAALLFEYVWYGDFPIDRESYERIAAVIDRVSAGGGVRAR